jgi:hypothetical protein
LSPYRPDFNPIERLWQHIKSHRLAGYITNKGCELEKKLFDRLQSLLRTPDNVQSICANRIDPLTEGDFGKQSSQLGFIPKSERDTGFTRKRTTIT